MVLESKPKNLAPMIKSFHNKIEIENFLFNDDDFILIKAIVCDYGCDSLIDISCDIRNAKIINNIGVRKRSSKLKYYIIETFCILLSIIFILGFIFSFYHLISTQYLLVAIMLMSIATYTTYYAVKALLSIIISTIKLVLVAAVILGFIYLFPIIMQYLQNLMNK